MRGKSKLVVLLLLLCFAIVSPKSAFALALSDPVDDTFDSALIDITYMDMQFDTMNLYNTASFASQVSESGMGNTYDLYGFIDLDVDQNPSSGNPADTDCWGATSGIGKDYQLDFWPTSPAPDGLIQLVDFDYKPVADLPITFGPQSFFLTLPLSLIGTDDGLVDYAAKYGTGYGASDIIPNTGHSTSAPGLEPVTMLLLGCGLVGLAVFWRKLKK